ncbi:hypothetical protein ACFXPY_48215 [Streptomyces sp. NPDC059153]|uniref:hypothetical protein n=1 Tax=Streptomyces sp. NPDC059153 TaxID=3346743 RepID=UPI0036870A0D
MLVDLGFVTNQVPFKERSGALHGLQASATGELQAVLPHSQASDDLQRRLQVVSDHAALSLRTGEQHRSALTLVMAQEEGSAGPVTSDGLQRSTRGRTDRLAVFVAEDAELEGRMQQVSDSGVSRINASR